MIFIAAQSDTMAFQSIWSSIPEYLGYSTPQKQHSSALFLVVMEAQNGGKSCGTMGEQKPALRENQTQHITKLTISSNWKEKNRMINKMKEGRSK